MKKLILSFTLLGLSYSSFAKPVSQEAAKKIAVNFIQKGTSEESSTLNLVKHYGDEENPLFYIFETINQEGFVIVSGDDLAEPILAYSYENGLSSASSLSPQVDYWLNGYAEQMTTLRNSNFQQSPEIAQQWKDLQSNFPNNTANKTTAVAPMLQTKWDQLPYYNILCPATTPSQSNPTSNAPAGCVATAMAQIMKFWANPTTGTGSHTYNTSSVGGVLSANFGATTYNWANMPNKLSQSSSTTQKNAIAKLMFHCGVSVEMNYAVQASGAYVISYGYSNLPCSEKALKNYFGYKSTIKGFERSNFNATTWMNMLLFEMDNGRPVLYSGFGQVGGHAFVFDGYDNNNKFHINWGWGGASNGYFTINNLAPSVLGTGAGSGNFNNGQEALIMIEPNGSTLPPNPYNPNSTAPQAFDLIISDGLQGSAVSIPKGSAYSITSKVKNIGTGSLTSSTPLQLIAMDTMTTAVTVLKTASANIAPNATYTFSYSNPTLTQLPVGVYYLIYIFTDQQQQAYFIAKTDGTNATLLKVTQAETPSGISTEMKIKGISIAPNPASSDVMVKVLDQNNNISAILVSDIQGRIIFQESKLSAKDVQLKTNGYSEGVYFLRVQTTQGTYTQKLIIQK